MVFVYNDKVKPQLVIKSVAHDLLITRPASDMVQANDEKQSKIKMAIDTLLMARKLVALASESGFTNEEALRALFQNNGLISRTIHLLERDLL